MAHKKSEKGKPDMLFFGVRMQPTLLAEARAVQERVGIPVAEQVRRGLRMWLDMNGTGKSRRRTKGAR